MTPATALAAVLLVTACGETSPYACPPLADGVEVVANRGPGAWAEDGLSPRIDEELWRRGGTREGEELSLPTFPAVSRGGRLALPDFRLAEATVIEPDGTWAGPWTRSGEGPGEVRSAVAAQWTPDGEALQAALGDTIWTFEVGELNETWVRARELRLEAAGGAN